MKQKAAFLIAAAVAAGLSVPAQAAYTENRRADIRGNNTSNGKCTIEVEVDGTADVEIRGDMGRLVTLSGQPSNWRRFECNGRMPTNPSDFRFRGIDGRGRVNLVNDPRSGRGIAVVRIEDTKGGREGYTFDLEWNGGSDYNSGGFGNGRFGDRNGRYGDDDGYYRDNRGGNGNGRWSNSANYGSVRDCESAVRDRLRRDGYNRVNFGGSDYTDRPRIDSITGDVRASRGRLSDDFQYSCAIDTQGRVRNVNVNRR